MANATQKNFLNSWSGYILFGNLGNFGNQFIQLLSTKAFSLCYRFPRFIWELGTLGTSKYRFPKFQVGSQRFPKVLGTFSLNGFVAMSRFEDLVPKVPKVPKLFIDVQTFFCEKTTHSF